MASQENALAWKDFFRVLKDRFLKDKVMDLAAALTFYGVLALFPFLLFLVTLTGMVLQPNQVEQFIREVSQVAPEDASRIIAQQIRDINRGHNAGLLTIGFVGAIWSASGGIVSLMDGLNALHHVEDSRPFWKTRAIAMAATLGGGALVLLAALVGVAAGPIASAFGGPVARVVHWLRLPVAGLLIAFVWATLYQVPLQREAALPALHAGLRRGRRRWLLAS